METAKFTLVDTHVHLDLISKDQNELTSVLKRAYEEGVKSVISVGIDIDSSKKAVSFARTLKGVFASVGIHPNDAEGFSEESLEVLNGLSREEGVKAWGEIGLDFYRNYTSKELQYEAFEAQLSAASRRGLPVIIHARDALDECIGVIKSFIQRHRIRGVFHCFSGDVKAAARVIDLGFMLSFTGVITFPNAKMTRKVAEYVPIEKVLIETDAPFLSPVPFRGKQNEPSRVIYVAKALSEVKKMDFLEVASCTTENAKALFDLPVP